MPRLSVAATGPLVVCATSGAPRSVPSSLHAAANATMALANRIHAPVIRMYWLMSSPPAGLRSAYLYHAIMRNRDGDLQTAPAARREQLRTSDQRCSEQLRTSACDANAVTSSAGAEQRGCEPAEPRLVARLALRARDVQHAIELDVVEPDQLVVVAPIDVDAAEEHRLHRRAARRTGQRARAPPAQRGEPRDTAGREQIGRDHEQLAHDIGHAGCDAGALRAPPALADLVALELDLATRGRDRAISIRHIRDHRIIVSARGRAPVERAARGRAPDSLVAPRARAPRRCWGCRR